MRLLCTWSTSSATRSATHPRGADFRGIRPATAMQRVRKKLASQCFFFTVVFAPVVVATVDVVSVGVATDDVVVVAATIVEVVSVFAPCTSSVPLTAIALVPVVGAVDSAVADAADSVAMLIHMASSSNASKFANWKRTIVSN